jgi:hypothetical protein
VLLFVILPWRLQDSGNIYSFLWAAIHTLLLPKTLKWDTCLTTLQESFYLKRPPWSRGNVPTSWPEWRWFKPGWGCRIFKDGKIQGTSPLGGTLSCLTRVVDLLHVKEPQVPRGLLSKIIVISRPKQSLQFLRQMVVHVLFGCLRQEGARIRYHCSLADGASIALSTLETERGYSWVPLFFGR